MERLRPRLLRTYAGPRGLRGQGRAGPLRRVGPAAPWISPQVDPRRYFSSPGEEGASPAPPPPTRARRTRSRRSRRGAAKENRRPAEDDAAPRRARPGPLPRLRPPLECSTPRQDRDHDQASTPAQARPRRPPPSPPPAMERGGGVGRPGPALLLLPPPAPAPAERPLRGACQLRASLRDGKLALSPPGRSEEAPQSPASLYGDSPQLQPVVLLDTQAVPNWLRRDGEGGSHHGGPGSTSSRGVPAADEAGPGATCGRKACISGLGARRWAQQRGRQGPARRQKNPPGQRKEEEEAQHPASLLRGPLTHPEMEDRQLAFPSSGKNSSLWRRIRASLSLHKKKKIRSEAESLSGSALNTSPVATFLLPARTPRRTPFTQKLRYSICPSSSLVLLSSMNSSSLAEVSLTDAEKVLGECKQEGPVSFEECIPPEKMQKCEKIGEGVFGEVFKTDGEKGAVALKIIPIEGSTKVNGEAQKTFREILPEIIISKELSLLTEEEDNQTAGFISLYSVHCVQGAYPERLLKAWDDYDRLRESENDRPDFFGDQQLFMVLEFEFGGTDLENMRTQQLNSVMVAKSILHQVTAALAVAEEALQFEHRDLHWGNVLVKKTTLKELSFKLRGESRTLPTQGVLVNIIDYTFSRLEKDGLTVYCDLSTDEEVFQGRGDYQFDIYRQMREENLNNWSDYFPHSNILWLHYLVDKLLKEVSYKKKPTSSSSMRQVQKQLELFSKQVLGFCSATELLNTSTFFH